MFGSRRLSLALRAHVVSNTLCLWQRAYDNRRAGSLTAELAGDGEAVLDECGISVRAEIAESASTMRVDSGRILLPRTRPAEEGIIAGVPSTQEKEEVQWAARR